MKSIHYDADGDILSITFEDTCANEKEQAHTGIQLTDNIILYFNPDTEEPLTLILSSYHAMMQASLQTPISLDGLTDIPATLHTTVMNVLQRSPLSSFLQLVRSPAKMVPRSRLPEIFAPALLQAVTAN